jgi:predicted transcriptional regulator
MSFYTISLSEADDRRLTKLAEVKRISREGAIQQAVRDYVYLNSQTGRVKGSKVSLVHTQSERVEEDLFPPPPPPPPAGGPEGGPSPVRYSVEIPELYDRLLTEQARAKGITKSEAIRQAVAGYLKQNERAGWGTDYKVAITDAKNQIVKDIVLP